MEVEHPAAKMLTLAASMQESEVGDASNLVIVLAGQLLEEGGKLLKMGLHPSEVVEGFERAAQLCEGAYWGVKEAEERGDGD